MALFYITRIVVFSLSIIFSFIELGLNAYFISVTKPDYFIFSALGVATALLTIITVPVMLFVDIMRDGALTSKIVFELLWLFVLWVLWVATAGESVNTFNYYYPDGCIYASVDPTANTYCIELQALQAFAFINFIIFFVYSCTLLLLSVIAASRGNNVWMSSVKESKFFAPRSGSVQHQAPQYQGTPATGYSATPVSQAQQSGSYSRYSGMPVHSQQQATYPGYGGAPIQSGQQQQAIPV